MPHCGRVGQTGGGGFAGDAAVSVPVRSAGHRLGLAMPPVAVWRGRSLPTTMCPAMSTPSSPSATRRRCRLRRPARASGGQRWPTLWIRSPGPDRKARRVRADRPMVRVHFRVSWSSVIPPGAQQEGHRPRPPARRGNRLRHARPGPPGAHGRRVCPPVGAYAQALLDGPLPWTKMRQAYAFLALSRNGDRRVNLVWARAGKAQAFNTGLIGPCRPT